MNVTRALLDGQAENGIRDADDRRVFRRVHQVLLGLGGRFLFVGELKLADHVGLEQIDADRRVRLVFLSVGLRRGRAADGSGGCRRRLFFELRDRRRVDSREKFLEVLVAHRDRLDHYAFDHAPHIVEGHDVVRVGHGEAEAVVAEADWHDVMLVDESARQQGEDARVDFHLRQVDEVHPGALVRLFETLGEQPRQEQRHLRVLVQHALEIAPLENRARRRLERDDARAARTAREERHLAEHLTSCQLVQREFEAGVLVAAPDGDQPGQDHERSIAGTPLTNDDRLGRIVAAGHLRFELRAGLERKAHEERKVLEDG